MAARTRTPAPAAVASTAAAGSGDVLDRFSSPTSAWFRATFDAPTSAQTQGWEAISEGQHTLVLAPTGSGKTLAAFLWALDRLAARPRETRAKTGVRVLYVSPLKALIYDVERNLRSPLVGIAREAQRQGLPLPDITVATRTGDTSAQERRAIAKHPPDILVTTPESLYLLLTSQARSILSTVETIVIDEIHAVAATKRGAHMALSLERLEAVIAEAGNPPPQRVGLSATQRPLEEVARFLAGRRFDEASQQWKPRDVRIVDTGIRKTLDLQIVVPVEDMGELASRCSAPTVNRCCWGGRGRAEARSSIWPASIRRCSN